MPQHIHLLSDLGDEDSGAISRRLQQGPIKFDFVYHAIPIAVMLEEVPPMARLKLVGDVGPMPYTAESAAARVNVQAILDAANHALGPVFRVTADNRILLGGERALAAPVTAVTLIEAVVQILRSLEGYLECIAVFLRPPATGGRNRLGAVLPAWRPGHH